jgi:hypothetical protein
MVVVCDIVGIAGKAPPVKTGQVKEIGVMKCPVGTFPAYLSHSLAAVALFFCF